MKYKKTLLLTLVLGFSVYQLTPIYQFYAHKHKAPMLPWGFISIPKNAPHTSNTFSDEYQEAASIATSKLAKHRVQINAPGLSVAVAIDNNLVWNAAVGWADLENNIPMTPNTKVRIGSTSKALTSAGLARLVAQHKLSLDTPLKDIFTNLPNPDWAKITPRQLASHMAGIPHYKDNTEFTGMIKTAKLNTYYENVEDAVALFDESELRFLPGEQFEYSSLGTVLLSAAMQHSAGMSYQDWMQQQVFTPLGLLDTQTEQQAKSSSKLAQFYWHDKETSESVRPWRNVDLSHRLAGGGWISTSSDLAKFGQGFISDNFISRNIRQEFWTSQKLNNGKVNNQSYAIGWRANELNLRGELGWVSYAHHGGVSRGAQSFLMVIPKYKLSLAVNINSNTEVFSDFSEIVRPLARLFISQYLVNTKQEELRGINAAEIK
jgi:serine beta-lactamase-like protein LACTB